MSEQNTKTAKIRPTKKQRELLKYIEAFIAENGYSPSYREIMKALEYNSVATVALHVNSLIKRGHLRKRDRSARSLELVSPPDDEQKVKSNQVKPAEEKWLVDKVDYYFKKLEQQGGPPEQTALDELSVLLAALNILGLEGAAQSFSERYGKLKRQAEEAERGLR